MPWNDEDFFRHCPPSRCNKHGPEIRFPFQLESSNTSSLCGAPGLKLACFGQDTILVSPTYAPYIVTAIDYGSGDVTLSPRVRVDNSSPSCRQKLMSVALPHSTVDAGEPFPPLCAGFGYVATVSCLTEFTPSDGAADYIYGPISCLSNMTSFSYLVDGYADLYVLPLDCRVVPDSFFLMRYGHSTFKENAEGILNFSETVTAFYCYGDPRREISENCTQCERAGRRCGFSSQRNQTFCMNRGMTSNWSFPYSHMVRFFLMWVP